jgi:hypothetical protein
MLAQSRIKEQSCVQKVKEVLQSTVSDNGLRGARLGTEILSNCSRRTPSSEDRRQRGCSTAASYLQLFAQRSLFRLNRSGAAGTRYVEARMPLRASLMLAARLVCKCSSESLKTALQMKCSSSWICPRLPKLRRQLLGRVR